MRPLWMPHHELLLAVFFSPRLSGSGSLRIFGCPPLGLGVAGRTYPPKCAPVAAYCTGPSPLTPIGQRDWVRCLSLAARYLLVTPEVGLVLRILILKTNLFW